MVESGLSAEVLDGDDGGLWSNLERENQRSDEGTVVRVSALPSELARIIRVVVRLQGSLVVRAGLGTCWVWLPPMSPDRVVAAIDDLRFTLAPYPCVVLDAPGEVRNKVDVWGGTDGPDVELMRRVKANFDPAGVCNPGVFLGGI
jgi:glycolate oxidase FAD binding subunit